MAFPAWFLAVFWTHHLWCLQQFYVWFISSIDFLSAFHVMLTTIRWVQQSGSVLSMLKPVSLTIGSWSWKLHSAISLALLKPLFIPSARVTVYTSSTGEWSACVHKENTTRSDGGDSASKGGCSQNYNCCVCLNQVFCWSQAGSRSLRWTSVSFHSTIRVAKKATDVSKF